MSNSNKNQESISLTDTDVAIRHPDDVDWLTSDDEYCEAPGCDRETEFVIDLVGKIWWCPVCREHAVEQFGDKLEPVLDRLSDQGGSVILQ